MYSLSKYRQKYSLSQVVHKNTYFWYCILRIPTHKLLETFIGAMLSKRAYFAPYMWNPTQNTESKESTAMSFGSLHDTTCGRERMWQD